MPKLQDYLKDQRPVLPAGKYAFVLKEIIVDDAKEHPTVQLKGEIDGKGSVIFRYLHPKMLWLVAEELVALGATTESEFDLSDAAQVAAAYGESVNKTLDVKAKTREYDGKVSNEFRITGVTDGAASGAV